MNEWCDISHEDHFISKSDVDDDGDYDDKEVGKRAARQAKKGDIERWRERERERCSLNSDQDAQILTVAKLGSFLFFLNGLVGSFNVQ